MQIHYFGTGYLGIEFRKEVKVLFQVRGKDGFNDQEAKTLELHMLQVGQEVVLRPGHKEVPCGRGVMVLQNRTVIVEHCLWKASNRG